MDGDLKDKIDQGIEEVKGKVNRGVGYIKGKTSDDQMAQSDDLSRPPPQRRQTLKKNAPSAQVWEPNQQSKPVPKYCPYCGNSLKGLFSCGDDEKMQSSDVDEGDENARNNAGAYNERQPQNDPQSMQSQRNVQFPQGEAQEGNFEDVQQEAREEIENSRQGPGASGRSDQSMQIGQQPQQKGGQDIQNQRSSKPAQKFCPYCASPLTGSAYCPNCGNKVK
jgi:hypothetical protein